MKVSTKNQLKINKYYLIAKVFLMATPFIAYIYLTLLSTSRGVSLIEIFNSEPSVVVIFINTMINPYIAYLLDLCQKKLQKGDKYFVTINFVLLLASQLLTLNTLGFTLLGFVFYHTVKVYGINVKAIIKQVTMKFFFIQGGGSFIVLAVSSFILFATIKLM